MVRYSLLILLVLLSMHSRMGFAQSDLRNDASQLLAEASKNSIEKPELALLQTEQAISLLQSAKAEELLPYAFNTHAYLLHRMGNDLEAINYFLQVTAMEHAAADQAGYALFYTGKIHFSYHEYSTARRYFEKSYAKYLATNSNNWLFTNLYYQGLSAYHLNDYTTAEEKLTAARVYAASHSLHDKQPKILNALAELYIEQERMADAREIIAELEGESGQNLTHYGTQYFTLILARKAVVEGDQELAHQYYAQLHEALEEQPENKLYIYTVIEYATLLQEDGDPAQAAVLLTKATQHQYSSPEVFYQVVTLHQNLAQLHLAQGEPEKALAYQQKISSMALTNHARLLEVERDLQREQLLFETQRFEASQTTASLSDNPFAWISLILLITSLVASGFGIHYGRDYYRVRKGFGELLGKVQAAQSTLTKLKG